MHAAVPGRNKSKIPGEVLKALIGGTEDVLQKMRESGVGIISTGASHRTLVPPCCSFVCRSLTSPLGTGGETADLGDLVRTVVVDSTVTARMPRKDVISNDNIRAGDVVVGLASYGQATYEDSYSEPSARPPARPPSLCKQRTDAAERPNNG